jgi:hypothetical protein
MPKKPTAQTGGNSANSASKGEKGKKPNPFIKQARARYAKKLRREGVAEDQIREKVKSYVATSVKPALNDAKAAAQAKNLTWPERKKFIGDTVRTKLASQS